MIKSDGESERLNEWARGYKVRGDMAMKG